jgi:hypothetical protein
LSTCVGRRPAAWQQSRAAELLPYPDADLTPTKAQLVIAPLQPDTLDKGIADGSMTAEGDPTTLRTLTALLDTFDPHFNLSDSQRRTLRCLGAPETTIFRDLPSSSRGAVLTTRFARAKAREAPHSGLALARRTRPRASCGEEDGTTSLEGCDRTV